MFENAVAFYLNEYLGDYVEGIDRQALTVSLLNGDVVLRNSTLRQDAFEQTDLPVSVRAGMLETLTLKVPWNALGSKPVVVAVDGLYLLVRASETSREASGASTTSNRPTAFFDAGFQAAKMSRVKKRELAWVKDAEKREAAEAEAEAKHAVGDKNRGFLAALIETIVGNLQVSIRNIHVRYEDDVTRPGHEFACGFTLQNLEAFTIDAGGDRSFVSAKAMDALRKAVHLRRCSVYFDCNLTRDRLWSPSVAAWRAMGAREWDAWFRPAIEAGDEVGADGAGSARHYQYVLRPVDGVGSYVRKADTAELDVRLDSIDVSVSREQYRNYSLLLSEATEYFKRLPFQAFRPLSRPTDDPKSWWLYLLYAHRQQAEAKQTLPWRTVVESASARTQYVSLYKVMLKMEDMRRDEAGVGEREISPEVEALYERDVAIMRGMEERLPESCILTFRRAARISYRAQTKAEAAAAAAARRESESSSSGWLGWLTGTGAAAPAAITTVTTKEEQDVIVDALAATALGGGVEGGDDNDGGQGMVGGGIGGRTLTYAVRVNSVSMNLVDSRATTEAPKTLLRGSMTGIGVEFVAHPGENLGSGTRDVRLRVEGSAIESYKGLFTESKALDVHFIQRPPEGLSDASLNVDMAPSFVSYDPEVVARVVDFFKPPEELVLHDLADLSVAAAAQLARARQLAQEYAVAAWSDKPKLDMRLALSAPKISIPSKAGDVHLALDFGMFVIETDLEGAAALDPRERGLYECIKVTGSRVSARITGPVVDWDRDWGSESRRDGPQKNTVFEPLLDDCSLDMALHVARPHISRYVDSELPALRASLTIPRIRLAMSPVKVNHLVRVLQNCMDSFQVQNASAVTSVSGDAWLSSAEWTCDCLVLQWGTLQSSASWMRRRLVLYASTLYAVEMSSNRIVRQWNVSSRSLVSRLSVDEGLPDADRVIVLHEGGQAPVKLDLRDVVRDSGSLVVKFDSLRDLTACVEEVHAAVHGLADMSDQPDVSEIAASEPMGASETLKVEVNARLTELQILLAGQSGRAADVADVAGATATTGTTDPTVDHAWSEVDIVCIRASEGLFRLNYGAEVRLGMSLVSVDVDDLLSSRSSTDTRPRWLAHSLRDTSSSPNLADFDISSSGLQTVMNVNLGSLCFYYNRPTVSALFAFGADTAAAFDDDDERRWQHQPQQQQQQMLSDAALSNSVDSMESILAPEIVVYCEKKDAVTFALRVALANLQLRLCYEDETSLAAASIADFGFSLDMVSDGSSRISVTTPKLEITDARGDSNDGGNRHSETTPVAISSGKLSLGYMTDFSGRTLDVVLQKPHVALDLGFITDIIDFWYDGFSYSKSEPLPFESRDMLLSATTLVLEKDVWLSPVVRLLADAVPGSTYRVNGAGHAIILPDARTVYDDVPLIMVGASCTLELINVTLINVDALSACVRLAPGARLDIGRASLGDRRGGGPADAIARVPESTTTSGKSGDEVGDDNQGQRLDVSVKMADLAVNLMPRRDRTTTKTSSSGRKLIAFRMGLESTYSSFADGAQTFKVDVQDMRAAQKALGPRSLNDPKATKEMEILRPMAISFGYKSTEKDVDMNLEISDIRLLVSPGSLAMVAHFGEEALAPLRQPGPDAPLCAVSTYRMLVSPPDTNGFDETRITFWRPTVPNGYVVAGDLAVGGDKAPSFEVIALARNSGLVAHPESFLPVVANSQLSLWLPVAPDGYAAMGLFATAGDAPPDAREVGCVARGAVIGAPLGSSLEHWGGFDGISLVNVDNAFGSFVPEDAGAFDLRFPVGPTTYGLSALTALGVEDGDGDGSNLQRAYMEAQSKKRRGQSRSVNSPKTMEFIRIWTDAGAFSGPAGVSIWRPVTHPGYGMLGDCFVTGLDPPSFVHLLRVDSYASATAAAGGATSAPPIDFEFMWHDGNPRAESRLTIWTPVAPEGFRSLGNIAHVGMTKPDVPSLCCVAERLAAPAAAPRRPVWRVAKDHLSAPPLSVWQVDDQTKCFFVDPTDHAVPPDNAAVLDMSSLEGREDSPGKTVNYVVRSPAVEVTFFDSFGVPMAHAALRNVESGIRGFHQDVVQVYGGLRPSLLAYNPKIGAWEHVIQPFDAIITGSLNLSTRVCSGIEPGLRVVVKSSTEMISTTLALSHVSAVVSAYEECIVALDKTNRDPNRGADHDSLTLYGGEGRRTSVMVNSLGVGVDVKLEDIEGAGATLVRIDDGQSATVHRRYGSGIEGGGERETKSSPMSTAGTVQAATVVGMKKIVGKRCISLDNSNVWRVVPETMRRPGQRGTSSSSVCTSVTWGDDTVVVEGRIREHVWHETLRSNFTLTNTTNIPLLVFVSNVDGDERSLGTVVPGGSKSLPLGMQRAGSQLHVTPALYDQPDAADAPKIPSASSPTAASPTLRYGWASVDVLALANSDSVDASSYATLSAGSMCTAHKTPLECQPAVPGSGLAMMFCLRSSADVVLDALDWTIDIVPPIKIRNHVPVPVSMFVADGGAQFSTPATTTADFPVHLDIVEPGDDLPIYFTGTQGSLRFRMDTGEYKWAESALACLTGPGQRDSVRLLSDTQRIPSEVVLSRYQTSPQCTYPVIVTLVSPLWILNKTDWMVEAAVVPVIGAGDRGSSTVVLDAQRVPQEDSYSAVLVTSVEDTAAESQGSLANARQVSPQSLVLSGLPVGGGTENQTRAYGLRIRVQRSGWTEPLLLDEEYAAKHGLIALSSQPLLLKADSPPHSAVFGTVLRLEMNEFNDSRILHIDAQIMLQNSCRVNLEGFQTVIDHHHDHRRRGHGHVGERQERIALPRGGIQLEDPNTAGASFVQIADNAIQEILKAHAIFDIPADSVPRPLTFLRGAKAPTLCFRHAAADTAYENVGMWSRPLRFAILDEGLEYLVVPSIRAGSLETTMLLRLRVTSRGPGLRMVTLESTECLPRYVMVNTGLDPLMYREAGWAGAAARPIPGLSAVGIVPAFSTEPDAFEVDIFGGGMESYARSVRLFDRSGDNESADEPVELVISSSKSCTVRTHFQPPATLSCIASHPIAGCMSGYTVGVGSMEKTVDIAPALETGDLRGGASAPSAQSAANASAAASLETYVTVEIPGISLSVIDFKREIVLVTVDDVKVEVDAIAMPNSAGKHIRAVAKHVQLDNMLPGTLLPVTVCRSIDSRSALPVVEFRRSSYQSKTRAGLHMPYVGFRTPTKLQLAVDERLVWKLVKFARTLGNMTSSPDVEATVRSIDALVRLRLLSVSPTALSVSFQNNAKARPPSFAESSYSMMLDLAAFKGAGVVLRGFEFSNIHVTRSSLSERVIERIRSELVGAGYALVRQFGIVGGATRLFGFLGAKAARFAEGGTLGPSGPALASIGSGRGSVPPPPPPQPASIGSSLLKGFRGVVGALAAPATKAQEKHDASFAQGRSGVVVLQRKRLPRVLNAMSGIRDVEPLGAASSSLLESLGQALLWSTWISSPLTKHLRLEGFEEHVVLPNGLVLLFTSGSLLLVDAPGFAALDGAAELGFIPAEVDPGSVKWRIEWTNLLDIQLASASVLRVIERGREVREVVCLSGTPQASQVKLIASRISAMCEHGASKTF